MVVHTLVVLTSYYVVPSTAVSSGLRAVPVGGDPVRY
jgi:hypothetical protein